MVKQDMEDVYTVGMGYMTGQGRPLDQKKGIEYLRQAADAGFLPAVSDLGVAYLNGQGVPPDAEKAGAAETHRGSAGTVFASSFEKRTG